MLLIRPITLLPEMVTASNAGSADPDYSAGTSYSLGQRTRLGDDGRTYVCVQSPALGQYPPTSPLYWTRAEPSNRWAMWDSEISTASTNPVSLSATLTVPSRFNSVSFHGLVGASLSIVQKSAADVTLFSASKDLRSNPGGWYAYYFEAREQVREAVFTGLTPSTGSRLEITITGAETACAAVVVGNTLDIGDAQYGFTSSIVDYSRKTTSTAGVQSFEPGRYAKRMSGNLVLERGRYNAIFAALAAVRATPCAWIANPTSADYEPLTMLGVYRDFQIEVSGATHHICSLEVESLT